MHSFYRLQPIDLKPGHRPLAS